MSAFIGYIFIQQFKTGTDMGAWMYNMINGIQNVFNPPKKNNFKAIKSHKKLEDETQLKIDNILDKINQKGYDNLSKEDKDFLEKNSN